MEKEKQIEDMIKVVEQCSCVYVPCDRECAQCSCAEMYDDTLNHIARTYYDAGYRLASEVAREIIADLEKILEVDKYGEAKFDIRELHKIEKKYTGEEG